MLKQQGVQRDLWHNGPSLIAGGVLLILLAQVWATLPAVSAIALIGRGAVLTLQSRPRTIRQDSLILVNLAVYCVLVCLAIVAESNAVLQTASAQVQLSMLLDHSVAIVLLAGLMFRVFSQFGQSTTE